MTAKQCPKCHKMTLRVVNVMGTTQRVHLACGNCCYKEKQDYNGNVVEFSPKIKLAKSYQYHGCIITEELLT